MGAPYRLVSLWDMLQLPIARLLGSTQVLTQFMPFVGRHRDDDLDRMVVKKWEYEEFLKAADALSEDCGALGLAVSKSLADDIAASLRRAEADDRGDMIVNRDGMQHLEAHLQSLAVCLRREAAAQFVFVLPPVKAELYSPREALFGNEVDTKFSDAAEDIEEAGKCLALGRPTAVVFHLMRAMELALQVFAARLSIANVDREWGKLLSDVNKAIEAMPRGSARDAYSQSSTHLYHVKQAWRNDVMHPKSTYTEDQAAEVFSAVRSFMRHLAKLV